MIDPRHHVLFITYDGLTDPLGQSQVLPYLEGLSKKGFRFTLMTFEKPDRFTKSGKQLDKRCAASGIRWKPLRYTKRPPVLSTLYDMRKVRLKAEALHDEDPVAMVHSRSYLPCLIAVKLKRKFNIPFLFDMRGFYADERVDGKIWNLRNPVYKSVYKYFKRKERHFLIASSSVISLTECGKEEILNWYLEEESYGGGDSFYNFDAVEKMRAKISVIPCAADLELFDYKSVSVKKKRWLSAVYGIDTGNTYLGYVGSLGTWYLLNEMLDFYRELREKFPEVKFLVVSKDDSAELYRKASEKGIPKGAVLCVSAERKDMPVLMSMMHASVFFIMPTFSKKASSPTKQGELMAMGVPVICNDQVGDSGRIVKEFGAGMVLKDMSADDYKTAVEGWGDIVNLASADIRAGALKWYSLEEGVERYHQVYLKILEQDGE